MTGCLVLGISLLVAQVAAQQGIVARNFRVSPGYHKPPNDRQMSSLLEGASAQPEGVGRYLVQEARFRTFNPQGATLMEVATPEARYNDSRKEIHSPQSIRMQTAEGRFSIQGEGFLWQQTNSSLFISNRVRTVVSPELLQPRRPRSQEPLRTQTAIHIEANAFDYHGETGLGTYRGDVRVSGTNMALAGESLTIQVPVMTDLQNATNVVVQSLALERNVVIDYEGVHATGGQVLYQTVSGMVEVNGNPAWRTQFREGAADRVTIDPSNRVFRAYGNATLKLTGPEVERAGLMGGWFQSPATNTGTTLPHQARPSVGRELALASRNYEVGTNFASFVGGVRVQEREPGQPMGTLECERLQLEFAGTNELRKTTAEGGVVAAKGDRMLKGRDLVYSGADQKLRVEGEPEWRAGERSGRGDRLEVNMGREEVLVSGNALMRLPAAEFAAPMPGLARTNPVAQPGNTARHSSSGTNVLAEISCTEYRVTRSSGHFTGEVEVDHPQMHWWSDAITVRFSPQGGAAEEIVAAPARFEVSTARGLVRGNGEHALYSHTVAGGQTNSLLTLTGSPASLAMTNGPSITSSRLMFDVARATFFVPPGKYRVLGPTQVVTDTNAFRFPRGLGMGVAR